MGDHVFICYARKDEDFVLKMAANLKRRGVPVWLDQWDIPAGANWDRTIDKALYDCAQLLIVLSPAAVASQEVQGELRVALNEDKPIVPVLYRACRIPRQLLSIQHVDFTSRGSDDRAALGEVLRVLGVPEALSPAQGDKGQRHIPPSAEERSAASVRGPGAIAQGGSQAAGQGGVAVRGDVHGDVVTGSKTTLFDQRGQHVERQINVAGDYHRPARDAATPAEADPAGGWNSEAIRDLLRAAFDDGELTTLCFDYFPAVYEDFSAGMSRGAKIQRLLEYCLRQGQVARLLEQVRQRNPAQYARFVERL